MDDVNQHCGGAAWVAMRTTDLLREVEPWACTMTCSSMASTSNSVMRKGKHRRPGGSASAGPRCGPTASYSSTSVLAVRLVLTEAVACRSSRLYVRIGCHPDQDADVRIENGVGIP